MTRRWCRALLTGVLFTCAAGQAAAHNFHSGITDIRFNARTGSTEIIHTFTMHDIEARLAERHQRQLDLGRAEDEKLLRAYIEQQFSIVNARKKKLAPNWVGISADSQALMIYQELPKTEPDPAWVIEDAILFDFLPDQANTLNLTLKGRSKTLMFDRSLPRQILR